MSIAEDGRTGQSARCAADGASWRSGGANARRKERALSASTDADGSDLLLRNLRGHNGSRHGLRDE